MGAKYGEWEDVPESTGTGEWESVPSEQVKYSSDVPTDEVYGYIGEITPHNKFKDYATDVIGLTEVPIKIGSDILTAGTGAVQKTSGLNVIPQMIMSKITGKDFVDPQTVYNLKTPYSQLINESALNYKPTSKGQEFYERTMDSMMAIPALNEIGAFNKWKQLQNLQKEIKTFQSPEVVKNIKNITKNQPANKALIEANKEGYVVTPSQTTNPTKSQINQEAFAGKAAVEEAARIKNQEVTDNLVRKYLGLADDAPIDKNIMQTIREKHGQTYAQIEKLAGKTETTSTGSGGMFNKPSQTSKVVHRSGAEILEDIKIKRAAERGAWNNYKFGQNAGDEATRLKAIDAGKQVEKLELELDNLLAYHKKPELSSKLKQARKDIAKTYAIENAMNPVTGRLDATKLAKADKKLPLDKEAKKIANFGNAYGNLAKNPKVQTDKPFGITDIAWFLHQLKGGNWKTASAPLFRPLTKMGLLSPKTQTKLINQQLNPNQFKGTSLLDKQQLDELIGVMSLDPYAQKILNEQNNKQ